MVMERQQDQPINMTAALEALAPLVNNPRRTVILAEASTSLVILLFLLQLILGSLRRQTSSAWVQGGTWVTYTLSFPAIAYTLGLMQSSPVKNVMYPIWAICILLAAGCSNAVKVYELGENKQWKRNMFNYFQYFIYTILLCWILQPRKLGLKGYIEFSKVNLKKGLFDDFKNPVFVPGLLLVFITHTTFIGRDVGCLFIELGYLDVRRVSRFMNSLPAANREGFDPVSMKGYRYPVHFPKDVWTVLRFILGYLRDRNIDDLEGTDQVITIDGYRKQEITIDQIWGCHGNLLRSYKGLKEVSLAYAMYQLLKRRYYGMACAEEHRPETRDFVLEGLLRGTDDDHSHERAFRIVEMELGFCHDYFFTKHAIIFELEPLFLFLFVVRISLLLVVTYFVWVNTLTVKTLDAIIQVQSTMADNIVTVIILGIIMLVELMQAAFYMSSDWCKVSVACRYVPEGSWYERIGFLEKLMGYLSRFSLFGHWKNRIDQYSVLSKLTAADMADESDLKAVKLAIVRTLRSYGRLQLPTNGEGSLTSNGVFGEFSWALYGRSQAESTLIWHIATESLNDTSLGNDEETEFNRRVSVSLSRYCAYMMHSAPELLPGYFGDTRFVMSGIKKDRSQGRREDGSILQRGEKLGKQLNEMSPGSPGPWKVLADFWTEKILYVAPSDNVKAHMERLAVGGEFLTHIWALLTHAGIHKINREEDNMDNMPSQASQETA